jgi:putative ABC transport system ATP-binding protein
MNSIDNTSAASAADRAGNPGLTAGTKVSASRESRRAPVLTVRGLTKTYGSGETAVDAVRSVDLDVTPGEVLLVMGPSGSGKTTLLLMLGALLRPTAGSITVTGRDGRGVDLAAAPEKQLPTLRSHTFGFIFQDYALLDALTATENIAVAANLAGTAGAAAHDRAVDLLDRVGLSHRALARPSQMSGGEQQRVAVARALANDPAVLLADEPTANLDASRGRDLARLLRRLADQDERSVVIVSHDDRLRDVADRVLWLEDGRFSEVAAMAVDPVCRMQIEAVGPAATWDARDWWFCSDACRQEFLSDPERFTTPTSAHEGTATEPTGVS